MSSHSVAVFQSAAERGTALMLEIETSTCTPSQTVLPRHEGIDPICRGSLCELEAAVVS